ncbi:unnamed protein product [Symbiodinium sp. CCMP2456]|nr:unnamed protein product [Symbiodinium sp. CCMP2456]
MASSLPKNEAEAPKEPIDLPKDLSSIPERSPCLSRIKFLCICSVLPLCNGIINGMLWAANSLHYQEFGWPLWRLGLLGLISALIRIMMTQITSWLGPWFSLLINLIHLGCLVPVLVTVEEEWCVALQIFVSIALDAILCNDAIVFFHYSKTEAQASFATSVQLQCFVLGYASASTIGGIVYDLAGWPGLVITHIVLQMIVCGILLVEPCVHRSIADLCCRKRDAGNADKPMSTIVPDYPLESMAGAAQAPHIGITPPLPGMVSLEEPEDDSNVGRSRFSTDNSDMEEFAKAVPAEGPEQARHQSTLLHPLDDGAVRNRRSRENSQTSQAKATPRQRDSELSRASMRFSGIAGAVPCQRSSLVVPDRLAPACGHQSGDIPAKSRLPRNIWLPALLCGFFSFVYNWAYVVEYVLFAIYFREQHNWNSATWAGVAQSSGDIMAAGILQLIARLAPPSPEKEEAGFNSGFAKKVCYSLTAKPYNLVWLCLWWVIFCLGMTVPNLPIVICSQVLMGTLYVISMQACTSMNTFYSLGDADVFLTLQLNSEALGMSAATLTAMLLYSEVHPNAPFLVSAGLALVALIIIFLGFFFRVGCGESLETKEAKRAERLGLSRQKTWSS